MLGDAITGRAYRTIVPLAVRCRSGVAIAAPERALCLPRRERWRTIRVTGCGAVVNGQDVANLDAYRTASPLFTITYPQDNVFDVEPGVAHAVSEGYSFIIAPPPPGEYEIAWTARYPQEAATRPMSTVTVVVEAPQVIEPPTT